MKKIAKSLSAFFVALCLICSMAAIPAFAADDELTVNNEYNFKVGDTFTYTYYLADAPQKVLGIQMYIWYDTPKLEVVPDSLQFEKFDSAVSNTDLDGAITFNWTNISKLADFSSKAVLVSVQFKVKEAGETTIREKIQELYTRGENNSMPSLTQYTLTTGYSDNGTPVKPEDPTVFKPVIETDPSKVAAHEGQFVNYADGKGADNPDVDDATDHQAVTAANQATYAKSDADNNNANNDNNTPTAAPKDAQGNVLATDASGNFVDAQGNTVTTDANGNYIDSNGNIVASAPQKASNVNVGAIVLIIVIVLVVLALIIVLILKKKSGKIVESGNDEEATTDANADSAENTPEFSDTEKPEELSEKKEDE